MQNAFRFLMKNRSFSSLINKFKIRIKKYLLKRKNFYFSSKNWGRFAFTFCRYFHHNLQVLPSESVAGNILRFRGKRQYIFQTKFFPLEFEGISYNSALLTNYIVNSQCLYSSTLEASTWSKVEKQKWPLERTKYKVDLTNQWRNRPYWRYCIRSEYFKGQL